MKRQKADWPQVVKDQAASGKSVREYGESIGSLSEHVLQEATGSRMPGDDGDSPPIE